MNKVIEKIGYRVLRNRAKKVARDKSVQNFDTAKSAVILFDTSLKNCFPPIKEFSKFLKDKGIKTAVFGYVPQKETPQEMLLWANFEFINRKDVNWFGSPKGEVVEHYLNKIPDMLFVISFRQMLPLEYLVWLSQAKFKIGCFTEDENDLDLMINPAGIACETDYFIEQVKHYIKLLNPKN